MIQIIGTVVVFGEEIAQRVDVPAAPPAADGAAAVQAPDPR
jgi:hypothetical protein